MQNKIKSLKVNYIFFHDPRSLIDEHYGLNKSINSQLLKDTHTVHHDYDTWGELFYDWSDLLILPLVFIVCIGVIYAVVYGWEYGWKWWQSKKNNTNDVEKCLDKCATNSENSFNVVVSNEVVKDGLKSMVSRINETWFAC